MHGRAEAFGGPILPGHIGLAPIEDGMFGSSLAVLGKHKGSNQRVLVGASGRGIRKEGEILLLSVDDTSTATVDTTYNAHHDKLDPFLPTGA